MENLCDKCKYNIFDTENEEYYCDLQIDEDDYVRLLSATDKSCRYFCPDMSEYDIVRRQN